MVVQVLSENERYKLDGSDDAPSAASAEPEATSEPPCAPLPEPPTALLGGAGARATALATA